MKELSPAVDTKLVIDMYNSGIKQVDIRKELGVAKSTISGIIKKYS
jgi:predicted transcriptional regulator